MVAKLDGTNGLLQQYDYQAPTTGFSYTFAAGVNVLVMNPAGTLATGTITMPASPADGMTISFSSTQTITALTVNANTGQSIVRKPTSFGAGSAMTFVYSLSNTTWYPMTNYATAGTVLQVVSTAKTDTFTTTSGSAVDITGLSVSITPSSTTSKILVSVMMETGHTGNDLGHSYLYLVRNSTNIFIADTAGSRKSATLVGNYLEQVMQSKVVQYLDSPSTTSSVTYKMQALTTAGTFCINRSGRDSDNTNYDGRGVSSITVMEIAA